MLDSFFSNVHHKHFSSKRLKEKYDDR